MSDRPEPLEAVDATDARDGSTLPTGALLAWMWAAATVIFAVREGLQWVRGGEPDIQRALFCSFGAGVILFFAGRGHARTTPRREIPVWIEGLASWIILTVPFLISRLILRSGSTAVFLLSIFIPAALTIAIMLRRSAWFLLVVPILGGVVGVLARPVLSVLLLSDVSIASAFFLGGSLIGAAAVPAWWMFRRAGDVGPRSLTIASLIAALMIPWIVATAFLRQ